MKTWMRRYEAWTERYNPVFLRALAVSVALILIGLVIVWARDPKGMLTVAVLKNDVPQYTKIDGNDVEEKPVSRATGAAAVRTAADLAGKTALVALAKGKPVPAANVTSLDPSVLTGRQRVGIPLSKDVSLSDEFMAGDVVDLLLSPSGDVPATGVVIGRVPVLSVSSEGSKTLFVALKSEELKDLATYAGRSLVFVVRSA